MFASQLSTHYHQPELQMSHDCGYHINGREVHLNVAELLNNRDFGNISGSLSLELWALRQPYQGGNFDGVAVGGVTIDPILGQHYLSQCEFTTSFSEPPAGRWYLTLMLREWTSMGFETRDYVNFNLPYQVYWTPILEIGSKANVVSVDFNGKAKPELSEPVVAQNQKPDVAAKSKTVESKKDIEPVKAKKISLNNASVEEINSLPGVSAKVAAEMVKNKPYKQVDDLLNVKGLGVKLLAKIRQLIEL